MKIDKPVTKEQLTERMLEFNTVYMGKFGDVTEETFKSWHKYLCDLDSEYFNKACDEVIKKNRTPPMIADIRVAYDELWGDWCEHMNDLNEAFRRSGAIWPDVTQEERTKAKPIWDRLVLMRRDDWDRHIEAADYICKAAEKYISENEVLGQVKGYYEWMVDFEKDIMAKIKK